MKKVIAIFAIVALASCGNASTETVVTDSTSVDSVKVDTTAIAADTTAKVDSVK